MTRDFLELALTRFPGLYSRLIAQRRTPNLEKIVFLSLVRRGDVVADVGANTGYYSLLFSHLVGASGCVHAFEPVPPTFAELEARMRRARFGNVVLNDSALVEEEKTTTIYLPGNDPGQAALTRHRFGSWTMGGPIHTYSCRATTLDAYVESRGIQSLDFVKCDVEGAELLVLRGALKTIRRFSPLLFLEVSRHWTTDFSYEPADLGQFLESFGYSRFFLATDRLIPISEVQRDLDGSRLPASANLLCAQERHASRVARLRRWLQPHRPMLESRNSLPTT
jgi:FkbM family methyltransferase